MTDWPELEKKYYMRTFEHIRLPVTLVRGEGARVWDDQGKEYLDFFAGLAVNSLGNCHPVVIEAVTEQVRTLIQTSNQFHTVPQLQLAELLVENSCLDRVFFCNSGGEATEGAVKLARRYGHIHLKGAYEVITTSDSFHGRTLAMTAASGQLKLQEPYTPLPSGFVNVKYNDINEIKAATTEKTCAVMLEPVQAEGGVNVPDDNYLRKVRRWCDEEGILLILDEVQTGIGRLGALFGYELYGVEPDILALAKGLGGGVAVGAFLAKERASVFQPGDHGSTFGGNPLACAAAAAVIRFILDRDIVGHVREVGQYLVEGLAGLQRKHPSITQIRGRGLLIAIQFDRDIAQALLLACLEKGLLTNRVRPNALRLIPPLIIGRENVDRAIAILDEALSGIIS